MHLRICGSFFNAAECLYMRVLFGELLSSGWVCFTDCIQGSKCVEVPRQVCSPVPAPHETYIHALIERLLRRVCNRHHSRFLPRTDVLLARTAVCRNPSLQTTITAAFVLNFSSGWRMSAPAWAVLAKSRPAARQPAPVARCYPHLYPTRRGSAYRIELRRRPWW